jgi:uncharacterized protein (TIGR00730 family)
MTEERSRFAVCVYCASSEDVGPGDRAVAAALGAGIGRRGWELVYGAGNVGLMGEVARAALAVGGRVTGVIPHRLVERELAHHGLTELIQTETMRQRKDLMDGRSDAFVVLPGGIGTLEEVVEILTLKQLGYHARPVVLLDPRGFWQPLLVLLERMVSEGFAHTSLLRTFHVVGDVDAALTAVQAPEERPAPEEDVELEAAEGPAPRAAGADAWGAGRSD